MKGSASDLSCRRIAFLAERFEEMYRCYNRPEYIEPDPVSTVRVYPDLLNREVAGVIASSLAYGRASQIVRSIRRVLGAMGENPGGFLIEADDQRVWEICNGFRHRFTDSRDLYELLVSMRNSLKEWGSLENLFASGMDDSPEKALGGLSRLSRALRSASGERNNTLLPDPSLGSACKRYHLFLKWMVREDAVDPGGWSCMSPADLMIPLDTHMHRICTVLGLVRRMNPDMGAVVEATLSFRKICPADPARYDFSLTRFGIRSDLEMKDLLGRCEDPC
ncbi:MAG TPA: TIGR02757 family protein [Synergistales bacterium]|nr:TIGR02757 family protein [Synergistales bacterium]